jgi:hypothetical protein
LHEHKKLPTKGEREREYCERKQKNNYYLLLEQCIIISATLAFHAMKIYWTLSLHLSFRLCLLCSEGRKVFKGIYDESCKAVVRRKKVFYVLALQDANYGPQLIREIFPLHKLPGSFISPVPKKRFLCARCAHAKGKSSQA